MGTPFLDANSPTVKNLEAAVAGESMAHIKYRYFAKLCREMGDEESAKAFEATAEQEAMHAFGHLDLLFPKEKMSPSKALQFAIDGETYEFSEMYPTFSEAAKKEEPSASNEMKATLAKAIKRFDALARVEARHAEHYLAALKKAKS